MTTAPAYAVAAVQAVIRARTGLSLETRADLGASLGKAMNGTAPELWAEALQSDGALFDQVLAAVTVGETYFFRDPAHFAHLREEFLPAFRARKPGSAVRAWSAGCSTGEEAYSLAVLFDEARMPADILATDINRAALAKAKKAVYRQWSLRGDGARLIGSALVPVPRREAFAVIPRLKDHVRFAYLNLADGVSTLVPPGGMDVIFCRNVLIYLDPEAIQRVARRLFDALAEGGVLITGPSDPVLADAAPFTCTYTPSGVRYTKDARKAAPRPFMPEPVHFAQPERAPPATPAPPPAVRDAGAELAALRLQANRDTAAAADAAAAAAKVYPDSRDIPYLHAILLMNLNRIPEAETVLRRLLYLDPSLAVAHFALGNLRLRAGDLAGARRAFKAAGHAAAARPAEEVLALSEGETAGQMVTAAAKLAGHDAFARKATP